MVDANPRTNTRLRKKIYLAGRVSANDWRHEIVAPVGSEYEGCLGHGCHNGWASLTVQGNGTTALGWHEFQGPFFTSGDHGTGHADRSHGCAALGGMDEATEHCPSDGCSLPREMQGYVFRECVSAIERATHVFAWIDDLECYGTLWELGYASAKGKQICIASPAGKSLHDLWFAGVSAKEISAQTPTEAFARFLRITECSAAVWGAPESPIEKQLLRALADYFVHLHISDDPGFRRGDMILRPQVNAGAYRLDFGLEERNHKWKIAIECDGHQFHERTKEQAQHDKSRDRDLVTDGWTVLRFTGSEIHRDAGSCAQQVLEAAASLSRRESA